MTRNSPPPSAAPLLSDEERRDIQLLIEEFGTHIDLDRVNEAFIANERSLTERDDEKTWIFQAMGYLKMDPRKVLVDERFFFLKR